MYTLIYWPFLQGRGEFVRLVLEDAGVAYDDLARRSEAGGVAAVRAHLHGQGEGMPGFAPPFLIHDDLKLAETPAICAYLGQRHGLAPEGEGARAQALQLQLSISDVVTEVHDTHHPLGASLYYEDQKEGALQRARDFRGQRLEVWLSYFEKVLGHSGGPYLLGAELSYPDLGLFQLVEGLKYAFPNAVRPVLAQCPQLVKLHGKVRERPRLAEYLASDRRLPFNQEGIFRHYPELDE